MQSSQSRLISGAVVTSLLLALIALIALTLLNNRDLTNADAQPSGAQPAAGAIETTQAALVETATAVALLQPETPTPDPASAPAVEPASSPTEAATAEVVSTPEATIEASSEGEVSAQTTIAAPELAITIQPTPTRRIEDQENAEASATATLALPTVDPADVPSEPLQFFANSNAIADVAWVNGDLWTATSAGARRWNVQSGEVEHFGVQEGVETPQMRAVVYCPLEGLGIVYGAVGGLAVHDLESGEWMHIAAAQNGNAGLPWEDITALACHEEAELLAVGSATDGIAVFNVQEEAWSTIPADEDGIDGAVRALALTDDGAIWIAAGATILQLADGDVAERFDSENSPLTGEPVGDLLLDGDTLWAAAGDRLFRLVDGEWSTYRAANAEGDFPTGTIVALQPASNGRIWIASQSGEVCRFDADAASCAPWYVRQTGMASAPITSLAANTDGELAYGTAGGGSSVLANNIWTLLSEEVTFPAGNRIHALATDTQGYLWVASNGGVQQTSPAAPEAATLHNANAGMTASNVRSILADAQGGVWLGGSGAAHFDGERWTNFTSSDGLADEEITAITQDSQSRIWFGTRAGLSIWTGSAFFNLTAANGLPDAEILSLAADANSVWIGSANGGLYRFENNQLQVLTEENVGLPSNRILALLIAPDRSLYVGTDAGMVRFARGEFNPVPGMPNIEVTSLAQGSNGELLAGTATQGAWMLPADATAATPWQPLQSELGQLPRSVRTVTIDLFGGAWLGSDGAGIARLSQSPADDG